MVIAVAVVVLGGLLIIAGWQEILDALAVSNWQRLVPALLMTAISYLCISYSFALVARLLGVSMTHHQLASAGFVGSALNHMIQSGGVAGYSVRYAMMSRFGVSFNDVLAASILHFYVTSLAMQAMLPLGFVYLLFNTSLSRTASTAIAAFAGITLVLFALATAVVLAPAVRRAVLRVVARITHRLFKRDILPALRDFEDAMTRGTGALRRRPGALGTIMGLVVVDWITSALALGFCFEALGSPLPIGTLFTGFVIGVMAGVLSSLPAGIGVQDGSMAGVFALLGVGFGTAVLASILFRLVFYVVPYVASLAFYWRLTPKKSELRS